MVRLNPATTIKLNNGGKIGEVGPLFQSKPLHFPYSHFMLNGKSCSTRF